MMEFIEKDTVIYSITKKDSFNKIATFDLDGTIIKTKSGKVFPIDKNDWELWNQNVKPILYQYFNDLYKIVIFTNQLRISKGKIKKEDFIEKIRNIQKELNLDFDIFIATADDKYRKPMTGMWQLFTQLYNIKIDKRKSFYCGDAAGREKNWYKNKKKDFSNVDIKFAHNIGLKFEIPENIFSYDKPLSYQPIDNVYQKLNLKELMKMKDVIEIKPSSKQETVILIGRPGSGKTFLSKETLNRKEFENYVYISRDICKTQTACLKKMENALKNNKSVWIDNTNPTKLSRKDYIILAKKYQTPVTVYMIDIPEKLSKHLNHMRVMQEKSKKIPNVVYHVYNKKYQEPRLEEDIDQIIKIPFSYRSKDNKYFTYYYDI